MKKHIHKIHFSHRQLTQKGFASIIVTTVLISVIGLILVGFSLSVRRNQRESLDRQLSTQAYYAAETAVNKVRADVIEQFKQTGDVDAVDDCKTIDVSDTPGIVAPCVTVDNSLENMFFNTVEEGKDTFVAVIPSDKSPSAQPVNNLKITWYPSDKATSPQIGCRGNTGELPARGNWPNRCAYGVLRLDISESDTAGNFNPNAFATSVILLPSEAAPASGAGANQAMNGAPMIHDPSGAGAYYVGADQCGDGTGVGDNQWCTKIISLNGAAVGKNYYIRMRSIYRNSAVEVWPLFGNASVLTKGQIQIDATGKAQDVLRRIQVRVPVDPGNNNTFGAIESTGSVCKRFAVAPGEAVWGGGANGLCQN